MAQPRTYHFVPDATNAPGGRKAVEKRARAHAAKVTHERRAAKRGAVVKWVNENVKSRATRTQLVARNPPMTAQFEISPWSQLSQAKVDPFETNPHTILPNQLQSILDWAYEYVHPKVLSTASENEASMIKISWRRVGQEWPMMFHLQVAAAVNLHRADADMEPLSEEIDAMAQGHSERGLNMVRKALSKLKGPPSDALIMAQIMVALLTTPDQTTSLDSFRRSPLATAQNLHRYARLAIVPHLIGALLELVTKRGGIESTRDFGNSQLLQFADLMISSRLGIPPSFPWLRPSLPILKGPRYQPDHQAIAISRVIGTGFKQLDSIDLRLANILRNAGEITVALDHYQECRPNAPRLADLINAANETHHKLLSIGVNMPPYPSRLDFLCDMCRLAGLIYSDFVLFSLPTTTQVRPRLATQLRAAMEQFEKFEAGRSATTYNGHDVGDHNIMVMWALILGGLASLNTPEKPYFVQKLREYVERVPYVSEWRAFSELMGTYLWWDYIFEEPGSGLWMEVVQSPNLHHRPSGDSLYQHSSSPTAIPIHPHHRPSGDSLYQHSSSPTAIPIHPHHRTPATELGTYGLPTPSSSEQSPQPAPNLQWEPIWTLPRDASLVHWVWT